MSAKRMKLGKGHWPDSLDDQGICTDKEEPPWEDWAVVLHGSEAGDYLCDQEDIFKVLKNLGYALVKVDGSKG